MGEVGAVRAATEAERRAAVDAEAERRAGDDPLVQFGFEQLVRIARGDPGYRGRHIGDRLRATTQILDRTQGKPREAEPKKPPDRELPTWTFPDAPAVSVEDAMAEHDRGDDPDAEPV